MRDLKLRAAGEKDIADISFLARIIWNAHYPEIIGQPQVDYMLQQMYSEESLREQMLEKQHRFFLIENENQKTGFISMSESKKSEWQLNKFYVDRKTAEPGTGTDVFRRILELLDPKKITLTVNRKNYKSINFYFKIGFKIQETALFDIGGGFVMDDFVMVWEKP